MMKMMMVLIVRTRFIHEGKYSRKLCVLKQERIEMDREDIKKVYLMER